MAKEAHRLKSKGQNSVQKLETDGHFGDNRPVGDGVKELRINFAKGYNVYLG